MKCIKKMHIFFKKFFIIKMPNTPFRILMVDDSIPQLKSRSRYVTSIIKNLEPSINVELHTANNAIDASHIFSHNIMYARPFNMVITDYEMPHPSDSNKSGDGDVLINFIRNSIKSNHDLSPVTKLIFSQDSIPNVMLISTRDLEDIEDEVQRKNLTQASERLIPERDPYLTVKYLKKGSSQEESKAMNYFVRESLARRKSLQIDSEDSITISNLEIIETPIINKSSRSPSLEIETTKQETKRLKKYEEIQRI